MESWNCSVTQTEHQCRTSEAIFSFQRVLKTNIPLVEFKARAFLFWFPWASGNDIWVAHWSSWTKAALCLWLTWCLRPEEGLLLLLSMGGSLWIWISKPLLQEYHSKSECHILCRLITRWMFFESRFLLFVMTVVYSWWKTKKIFYWKEYLRWFFCLFVLFF